METTNSNNQHESKNNISQDGQVYKEIMTEFMTRWKKYLELHESVIKEIGCSGSERKIHDEISITFDLGDNCCEKRDIDSYFWKKMKLLVDNIDKISDTTINFIANIDTCRWYITYKQNPRKYEEYQEILLLILKQVFHDVVEISWY